jgi:hypothetical protein
MPSNVPIRLSGPLGWAIAGAAAAIVFAAGALTARALYDDPPPPAQEPGQVTTDPPGGWSPYPGADIGVGRSTPQPGFVGRGGEDALAPKHGSFGPYGCQVPLPAATMGLTTIDLEAAGLSPRVPRNGFELLGATISSASDCTPQGQPTGTPRPVLMTTWRHAATGLDVYLTQAVTIDPVAPVLRTDGATFSALGYLFSAYVNPYMVRPFESDRPVSPLPDPRAAEVLRETISQVVPGFDQQCFWTVAEGDWADLAAAGIGDPRPAVPAGLTLGERHITTFRPPAAGCDTSIKPTEGLGLYAHWHSRAGDGASLGVSVSGLPQGFDPGYPGYIDQFSANWSRGGLQFSVWYSTGREGDPAIVRALARALDPAFDDACFIQQRTLTEADLPGLGLRAPTPPSGYTVVASNLSASDVAAGCARPDGFVASYSLSWTLQRGTETIDVHVHAAPDSPKSMPPSGWIGDYGLGWVSADATSYSVNGYSKGATPTVPRDDLIAVALSLDPTLDVSKLDEQTGGGRGDSVPPMPAPDKPN